MNRPNNKESDSNSNELFSTSSSSSSPPSYGVSRISIGSSNASNGGGGATDRSLQPTSGVGTHSGNAFINSGTLMNGNGELVFRRSPVTQHHLNQQHNQSYYTLGSPSLATSYNSEDISDTINSSYLEDGANNPNGSLCVRVEQLQRQVGALSESQASQDERYKRTRQENDELLNRIHVLEDQLRELEIQSETRSREDEKRFKETMTKQMKLKSQECEQHLHTNYQLQQDIINLQKDLIKNESIIRMLRSEKEALEAELNEKNSELTSLDDEVHKLKLLVKQLKDEEVVKSNLINILNEELEDKHNRSHKHDSSTPNNNNNNNGHPQTSTPKQSPSRRSSTTSAPGDDSPLSNALNSKALKDIHVLEANLDKLREDNRYLKELNEELQGQLLNFQLEEGRSLIQEGNNKSYSLADELGDIDVHKLMGALKDQQEDNARLRKYIDEILLKIVENNPEILDKTTTSQSDEPTNKKADVA